MKITKEIFEQQKYPQFGNMNPEIMKKVFWEYMVRKKCSAYAAREQFNAPFENYPNPIWSFDRFGMSRTELKNGKVVCVGGEHEDSYDPDFHIYNDVVVSNTNGTVEIFGYPKTIFEPTDFHTALSVEEYLFIIGCLGYSQDRKPGFTPVYRINCANFSIERAKTYGENPGWIFGHKATLNGAKICIKGGTLIEGQGKEEIFRKNQNNFTLDLTSFSWIQE